MKIAQVAPLYESVPPKCYGGTERIVSYLTEELVRQGHNVTLFASADSITSARLVPCSETALRLSPACRDPLAHHVRMMGKVHKAAAEFDIIHYHIDYLHFPLSRLSPTPNVTTLHGRLDLPELGPLYRDFSEMPVVSISESQRGPIPWANWSGTVYHGLPENLYSFHEKPGGYLAFLGRISPEKRVDRAIDVARRSGMKLKIAAKVDRVDQEYFEREIKPLLNDPLVEFIGEIGEDEKNEFLGNAYALLFPIDWPEPFGMVMIEAMACGTPVIAYRNGSVLEVMVDGLTGFIVENQEEALQAVEKVSELSRGLCREVFERRYTSSRMASGYLNIYRSLCGREYKLLHPPVPKLVAKGSRMLLD